MSIGAVSAHRHELPLSRKFGPDITLWHKPRWIWHVSGCPRERSFAAPWRIGSEGSNQDFAAHSANGSIQFKRSGSVTSATELTKINIYSMGWDISPLRFWTVNHAASLKSMCPDPRDQADGINDNFVRRSMSLSWKLNWWTEKSDSHSLSLNRANVLLFGRIRYPFEKYKTSFSTRIELQILE